jgi:hypothetical protein
MRSAILILLLLIISAPGYTQRRLTVQCDRYMHLAGDTVWFETTMLLNGHKDSHQYTNQYVDFRTNSGGLVVQEIFPIIEGQSIGQLCLPDTLQSGVYWLRFYTTGRGNKPIRISATIPLTVYQEGDKKISFMEANKKQLQPQNLPIVALTADTLNPETGGYNNWRLDISDTTIYHFFCSITDAALPMIDLTPTMTTDSTKQSDVPDSSYYLSWTGKALKPNRHQPIKSNMLMTMLVKDSVLQMSKLLPIGPDGNFRLKGLFFFGKAQLLYQVNRTGTTAKEVNLVLDSVPPPLFKIPSGWVSRDTLLSTSEIATTVVEKISTQQNVRVKGRQLKEVKIQGWVNPRKKLDSAYTTGIFSEPALYAFDVRKEKRDIYLNDYLRMQLSIQGGFSASDTPTYPNHPLLFYVNEVSKTWDEISDMTTDDIAYIKAIESDFIGDGSFSLVGSSKGLKLPIQQTPMIVMIYTRKGKDIKKVPGLNQLTLTGYTTIARFTPGRNGATLLWAPFIDANHIRLRFYNNCSAKSFRLTMHGFSDSGKEIYYRTIITTNGYEKE